MVELPLPSGMKGLLQMVIRGPHTRRAIAAATVALATLMLGLVFGTMALADDAPPTPPWVGPNGQGIIPPDAPSAPFNTLVVGSDGQIMLKPDGTPVLIAVPYGPPPPGPGTNFVPDSGPAILAP